MAVNKEKAGWLGAAASAPFGSVFLPYKAGKAGFDWLTDANKPPEAEDPFGGVPAWQYAEQNAPKYSAPNAGESVYSVLRKNLKGVEADPRALAKLRAEGLREGPSAWGQMRSKQQMLEEQAARDQLEAQLGSQDAMARSQLAMRGGLQSGARERLARGGAQSRVAALQGLSREGRGAQLGIAMEDERRRMDTLRALPGMEIQAIQPAMEKAKMYGMGQQADLSYDQRRQEMENAFNLQKYKSGMEARSAERQAQATERSGK